MKNRWSVKREREKGEEADGDILVMSVEIAVLWCYMLCFFCFLLLLLLIQILLFLSMMLILQSSFRSFNYCISYKFRGGFDYLKIKSTKIDLLVLSALVFVLQPSASHDAQSHKGGLFSNLPSWFYLRTRKKASKFQINQIKFWYLAIRYSIIGILVHTIRLVCAKNPRIVSHKVILDAIIFFPEKTPLARFWDFFSQMG